MHNNPVNGIDPSGNEFSLVGQVCVTAITSALISIGVDVIKNVAFDAKISIGQILLNSVFSAGVAVLLGPLAGKFFNSQFLTKATMVLKNFNKLRGASKLLIKLARHPKALFHALAFTRAFAGTLITYFQSKYQGVTPSRSQIMLLFVVNLLIAYGGELAGSKIGNINEAGSSFLNSWRSKYAKLIDNIITLSGDSRVPMKTFMDICSERAAKDAWNEIVGYLASSENIVASMIITVNNLFQKGADEIAM